MAKRIEVRRALVTGAASGIGAATALELAARGASLELVDIDAAGLEQTARRAEALGVEARRRVADLARPEEWSEVARWSAEAGPLDLLVNCAGVAVVAPFSRTRPEDLDWLLSINLRGTLGLTRALLSAMLERGHGQVVVVASLSGLIGAPGMVAYSTSKFALVGFCEALRFELEGTGVGVTAVCPGRVPTRLHATTRYVNEGFRRFLDRAPGWYGTRPETVARRIVEAATRREPLVVLGVEQIGWWLKRFAPELAFRLTGWVARLTGIDGRPELLEER